MTIVIFIVIALIGIFIVAYRSNDGGSTYKFIANKASGIYDKVAPYSYKEIRAKVKELGQEYTTKQYVIQIVVFAASAAVVSYLYFYNLLVCLVYIVLSIVVIPYLTYLRCKRIYSEFIFEQVQIYTTNVIMEFNTTQSFVKSLEGVRDSGILEDPVLGDVKTMIDMSYQNGTIDESILYFNHKYPFYMVKNMNRKEFHTRFITFGLALFLLVMAMQFLLGTDSYLELIDMWYVQIILHAIIIINCFFLITGEKFYYEDVGVE